MFKLQLASLIAVVVAFAATAPACSSVENAFNCDQICDRYQDCIDSNYDAEACQTRCENSADDTDYAERAADCQECLDGRTCSDSLACIDECIGIVP